MMKTKSSTRRWPKEGLLVITGAQKRVRCFVGYWSFPHSVEVHVAVARMFVTFCSAVSQHHVVKRFFYDTERNVSRTIVLQLFLFDSEDQDNFGGILHA